MEMRMENAFPHRPSAWAAAASNFQRPPFAGVHIFEKGGLSMSWQLYILRCGDGTLYTGITDDLPRRLKAHRSGKGAKYTRGRGPLELVYREDCPDKSAALRREIAVKKLSRQEKLFLIGEGASL